MASFSADCPHCGTKKVSFQIFGVKMRPNNQYRMEAIVFPGGAKAGAVRGSVLAAATCPECNTPVAATLALAGYVTMIDEVSKHLYRLTQEQNGITAYGYMLENLWPVPPMPVIPDHISGVAQRAYLQAEQNFAVKNIEAAIAMYGQALEKGLKAAFPDIPGQLNERINRLTSEGVFPPAIKEWATVVRFLRNDAAHDLEDMTEADMIAARNFTDAVLRYAITLPAEVAARRKLPPEKGGDKHVAEKAVKRTAT